MMHLELDRWYAAPRNLVWRAFTEARLIERWLCPNPQVRLEVEHCDVRPGGPYRYVFYFPDGTVSPVIGEFQTLAPPDRLSFTWTWEASDPWAGVITLVTVHLREENGGTRVALRHEGFPEDAVRQRHFNGWNGALDRLTQHLQGEQPCP